MVSCLLRLWKYPGEEWGHFRSRQSRASSRCIEAHGRWWAREWMKRCVKWNNHLQRDFQSQCNFLNSARNNNRNIEAFHTIFSWAPQLINFLDEQWFRERRTIRSYNLGRSISSRTVTRVSRGAVLSRWHDRVVYARSQTL